MPLEILEKCYSSEYVPSLTYVCVEMFYQLTVFPTQMGTKQVALHCKSVNLTLRGHKWAQKGPSERVYHTVIGLCRIN